MTAALPRTAAGPDAGTAHATTLGLTLGFANGALLIEPTGWTRSESVLNLLFLGSAVGAPGGFNFGFRGEKARYGVEATFRF